MGDADNRTLWVSADVQLSAARAALQQELAQGNELYWAALQSGSPVLPHGSKPDATHYQEIQHPHQPSILPQFASRLAKLPPVIIQYQSPTMKSLLLQWQQQPFSLTVCDGLLAAPNLPTLHRAVLLLPHVAGRQTDRSFAHKLLREYEGRVCRSVRHVLAWNEEDAVWLRREYDATSVQACGANPKEAGAWLRGLMQAAAA